jgi:hypothetical protein
MEQRQGCRFPEHPVVAPQLQQPAFRLTLFAILGSVSRSMPGRFRGFVAGGGTLRPHRTLDPARFVADVGVD